MSSIPRFDLREFTGGGDAARREFASGLVAGLKRYGFIVVSGHGVPQALMEDAYRASAAFFALPEAEKRRHAGALRGYTPFGIEHARQSDKPDLKEFWQIGHEPAPGLTVEHPNTWPEHPAEFRATFTALFDALFDAGGSLLSAIALDFGLEEEFFDARIAGGQSLLRLLHYPPVPEGTDPGCVRAAAHEDINLITLLIAANGAGLELLDRDGRWLPVEAGREDIIVDTGDMMARITGGVLPATTHRVVNPAGPNVSRYSMPFFVQPRSEVLLEPLPGCRSDAEPITAGEYLNQRLKEIGLPAA
ncbi:isopenicillin N synthase family oxygenase [Marinicauda algicola]|uniref:2-oxoglutarate-dependent ethylene/succinate-forming enzyme n=1 Tax=Marinicauda algicola TaxID=2029849 RepID=A0A4S2GXH3_9PROT|nr:2-oxoglutarate and iron-dependent oxygenase domain-containing protein [Marinicauda algicola]TGY87753.1 isopenicillin N synthase family oxygenase [Marinicauda algicola]